MALYSLWNRFHRKDYLLQACSDLVRHNNGDNCLLANSGPNYFVRNCTRNSAQILPTCALLNRSHGPTVLHYEKKIHQALLNKPVLLENRPFSNSTFVSSENLPFQSDFIDFKSLSTVNKKYISRIIGLKASFLQELNFHVTKDIHRIIFDYASLDDSPAETSYQIHYLMNYYRTKKFLKADSFKEIPQSSIRDLDFAYLSFDSNFLNESTSHCDEEDESSITIFDDPFNALAFYQQTKLPTVVFKFPNRQDNFNGSISLSQFCSQINQHYKKIYFWSNDVDFCQRFRKNCSEHFDRSKLFRITGVETALQMLHKDNKEKFESVIETASHIDRPGILPVAETLDELFYFMNSSQIQGVQWARFDKLNEHLRGHRAGELTIVTGPTGSGKTTFVSEYSLDLCEQGVPTLWGSFEIQYLNLERKMLTQFIKRDFDHTNREQFLEASVEFSKLPLYFMKFHGQTDFEEVIEEARHAVLMRGVRHVIIDNLQFMLGLTAESSIDRFYNQDLVMASIREFATQYKCHVTLVAHPRKEKEEMGLSNNSLYGGIKASQEADNIMIIVNKFHPRLKCNKYVQITKNRAFGNLGLVPLYYDKNTFCYSSRKSENSQQALSDVEAIEDESNGTSKIPIFLPNQVLSENDLLTRVNLDEKQENDRFEAEFDDTKEGIHYENFKAFLEEQKKAI